jgi:fumarate hydratase subunit alpha
MEVRLLKAINQMDFGPMGTGGDTSAMSVNIDFAYSHGFVPVAVCINCWINRRTSAKIYNDGRVENLDW